jgi:hypothetical protein
VSREGRLPAGDAPRDHRAHGVETRVNRGGSPETARRDRLALVPPLSAAVEVEPERPAGRCHGRPGDCGPCTLAQLAELGRAGRCCRDRTGLAS